MTKEQIAEQKNILSQIATKQQGTAANPQLSVWVEASAGTGKTKVLSDRVLRLLLNDVNPAKILCLTYTKAAAVEMNSRISARLAKWAVMPDEELTGELIKLLGEGNNNQEFTDNARTLFARLLDVAGGMKIQTIHSFCQEILKRFPLEAGISPYFNVMDDRMTNEALENISRQLIVKVEKEPETEVGQAIAYLTGHIKEFKFSELLKTLMDNRNRLLQSLSTYGGLHNFLDSLKGKLAISGNPNPEEEIKNFREKMDLPLLKQIADALVKGSAKDKAKAERLYTVLGNLNQNFDYNLYKSVFLTQKGQILADLAYKDAIKAFPDIIEHMQKEAERIVELESLFRRLDLYQSTSAVMTVADELTSGYTSYKQQNARLDYEDLIVLTKRLLQNTGAAQWVLFKLDGGINHILIDEAQDTSPNQWAIIKAITDEFFAGHGQENDTRTVFAVGDRKQSIYSFQGADPEEFDKMYHHFVNNNPDFTKIRLDVSFRSTKAVLDTVNNLFSLPQSQSGVVISDEAVNHVPYRLGEGGYVEIWPLVEPDNDDGADVWYPPIERKTLQTASSKLAKQIAERIKNMVMGGEILISANRPIRYSDFMILVQRRNIFIEELVRECKNKGVNVTGVDKLKLLEQIAVEDLLSLGKFLLLPSDDLSLAEVLKSPLFNLDDNDLLKVCPERNGHLWQQLKADSQYAEVAQTLSELLIKSDYLRPFELFNYVLTTLQGRKNIVARLGSEAEDAIDEFINLTLNFEAEHTPSLENFMRWIGDDEVEVKRELEQAENDAVRIMTVHGSKGLQAPIVILPDTTRIANMKKGSDILWGQDSLAYFPLSAGNYDSICEEIHEREKSKAFDEYRRLLYVALTRAEDRLYICGYKSKNDINEQSWYNLCRETLQTFGEAIGENYHYACPQIVDSKTGDEKITPMIKTVLPEWITQKATQESPLAKPYTPSRPEDEDQNPVASPLLESGNYFLRGLLIHKLLQFLPTNVIIEEKNRLTKAFLQQNAPDLSAVAVAQITKEVEDLLTNPEFAFLFGEDSRAEVPIVGEVDGRLISAQLDRLIVSRDKVTIVDFKTNRPAANTVADVPELYLKQLAVYKRLVAKIYPDLPIETYILWTNTATLMKIAV